MGAKIAIISDRGNDPEDFFYRVCHMLCATRIQLAKRTESPCHAHGRHPGVCCCLHIHPRIPHIKRLGCRPAGDFQNIVHNRRVGLDRHPLTLTENGCKTDVREISAYKLFRCTLILVRCDRQYDAFRIILQFVSIIEYSSILIIN